MFCSSKSNEFLQHEVHVKLFERKEFLEQHIFPENEVMFKISTYKKYKILARLALSVIFICFSRNKNTSLKGNRPGYIQGVFTRSC